MRHRRVLVDLDDAVLSPFDENIVRRLVLIVDARRKAFSREILQYNRSIVGGSRSVQTDVLE